MSMTSNRVDNRKVVFGGEFSLLTDCRISD